MEAVAGLLLFAAADDRALIYLKHLKIHGGPTHTG